MTARAVRALAALLAVLVAAGTGALGAPPAAAQTDGDVIPAEVRFRLGPFDRTVGDWPVVAVELRGDLLDGELAAVMLEDASGTVLWEGEAPFTPPALVLTVDRGVPIGAVVRVVVAQQGYTVASAPVASATPPVPDAGPAVAGPAVAGPVVAGEAVEVSGATTEVVPDLTTEILVRPEPRTASPSVREVVSRGAASAPRLAVSLIVLLVLFAIVFRLPLVPIGGTARWRR